MINELIKKVENTIDINKLFDDKGNHIVVGVSGGPDSVCLISILKELSDTRGLSLHGVHINHCLRGSDADEDQFYTERLCKDLEIPCHVFRHDINALSKELKITAEEAGRRVRYQAYEKVRLEIAAANKLPVNTTNIKIAVAHNMNDQAETLMMRIIRGTGTEGLSGMDYVRDGIIIRPLLDASREEIENYCKTKGLNPRIDLTNLEPMYTRNRLRLELLPLLEEHYNKNILTSLIRLASIAREDKEFFDQQLKNVEKITLFEQNFASCNIDRKKYMDLHPALGKRLINQSLKKMGMYQDMTAYHLDAADELLRKGKTGNYIEFPSNYGLSLEYDMGLLYSEPAESNQNSGETPSIKDFCYFLNIGGEVQVDELKSGIIAELININRGDQENINTKGKSNSKMSALLDVSALADSGNLEKLLIRNRRPGDYIVPLGMKGRKKLQDFFTDEKISRIERDKIPLLCYGNEILWIIGFRINENYKITDQSKEILQLEYIVTT